MTLLDVAKTALRLSTTALDGEISDEVDACLLRLHIAGAAGAD